MTRELADRLIESNEDIRNVFETFSAIEQVYMGALRAMGLVPEVKQQVTNSADVRVSFSPSDRVT